MSSTSCLRLPPKLCLSIARHLFCKASTHIPLHESFCIKYREKSSLKEAEFVEKLNLHLFKFVQNKKRNLILDVKINSENTSIIIIFA